MPINPASKSPVASLAAPSEGRHERANLRHGVNRRRTDSEFADVQRLCHAEEISMETAKAYVENAR